MSWKHELEQRFPHAPINKLFGSSLTFNEDGDAVIHLPYNPDLTHPFGIHGGVIATLLDNAGFFASASLHEGVYVTTSEFNIHFMAPAIETDLYATGHVVKSGKRTDVCEMKVYDAKDKLVAMGSGTFVILHNMKWDKE